MSIRIILLSAALLAGVTAQNPPNVVTPGQVAQEKVEPETPEQRIERLEAELAALKKELEFIKKIAESGGLVARVKDTVENRTLSYRTATDRGTPRAAPRSRLLREDELANLPKGTIIVVNGASVTQSQFDELYDYLRSYPQSATDEEIKAKVVEALIVTTAVSASFDSAAEAKKKIAEIKAKLDEGGDFAKLANEFSQGPSGPSGGDLGFFDRNTMDPMFARAAFNLKVGEVSEIVQSQFGYHLIKTTAYEKGETPDRDRVKASHILRLYNPDQAEVRQAANSARSGSASVVFATDEVRQLAPPAYRGG